MAEDTSLAHDTNLFREVIDMNLFHEVIVKDGGDPRSTRGRSIFSKKLVNKIK